MIKARTRRILQGADYSAQEPRVLTQLCEDPKMLQAYKDGKDLYVEIASIALHLPYNECLEHFPKGSPITKRDDGKWYYATEEEIKSKTYTKLADGDTDTYKVGKERRNQAKKILLGIMYGRGEKSIAEQLECSIEEARDIKNNVYDEFPNIQKFERLSAQMVREKGYVTTLWGRKRRLPDYNLPNYEYQYVDNHYQVIDTPVPEAIQKKHNYKLNNTYKKNWKRKCKYIDDLLFNEHIKVIDNNSKIADASRQIINSRVQGSAADMSKLALIKIRNDEELIKRGVKIIIPVHDEILIETPLRYALSVKKRFAYDMETAATSKLTIPITCDVVSSERWYGDELDVDAVLGDLPEI